MQNLLQLILHYGHRWTELDGHLRPTQLELCTNACTHTEVFYNSVRYFQNPFMETLSRKFAIKRSLKIPPHVKRDHKYNKTYNKS